MLVQCVKDSCKVGWPCSTIEKIEGLTLHRQYEAFATTTSKFSITFFLYNDFGKWETYDPENFKPVNQHFTER